MFPAVRSPFPLAACFLVACGAGRPANGPRDGPAPAAVTTTQSATVTVAPPTECGLACEPPQMVPRPIDQPDYTAQEIANANDVLGAMQDDLLACCDKRLAVNPRAHAFMTVDVVIGPDGRVRTVETTGGALLGDATIKCIEKRIERGVFESPHGGGTLRLRVPFSLTPISSP